MQFHGSPLQATLTRTFALPRPGEESLPLRLQPLPLGFHLRLRARGIAPPLPPMRLARDSQGRPLKDPQGLAISLQDTGDADYLHQLELYHQRVAVLAVAHSLQADPHLRFESLPPVGDAPEAWATYADQLFQELERAGFTPGDLVLLCREICRLSNLIDDHVQAAQANFSSSPPIDSG